MGKKIAQLFNISIEPLFPLVKLKLTLRWKLLSMIFAIAMLQLLLRLGCLGEYGFHQDELLYLALSDRLAWGYREVPPLIALIGNVSKTVLGDSVTAVRVIPSVCAAAIVVFTGLITLRLGGRFFAVFVSCTAVAFSPAFLATGALFIPQVFDELCWVASAYLLIVFLQSKNRRALYCFGIVAGIGMLVKYTYFLYGISLLLGIALQPAQRHLLKNKSLWFAIGIALIIFSPHLFWQLENHLPALSHYSELQETQLVYLSRSDFLTQQLVVNGTGFIVWIPGIFLLFNRRFRMFRFLGVAALLVMLIIGALNGKPYYAFGCFPPLFALGGIFLERLASSSATNAKSIFLSLLIVPNLLLALIVLPYLPIEKTAKVFEWTYINLGIHYPLKWEDQKIHNMNQNYADMIGWEELASKTAKLYKSLSVEDRKHTVILAEKYGEAGAIDQYQQSYGLPPVISLCSSYALWAPPQLTAKNVIYVSSSPPPKSIRSQLMDKIKNPYSRVFGLQIYLIKNIDSATKSWYSEEWKAERRPKKMLSSIVLTKW